MTDANVKTLLEVTLISPEVENIFRINSYVYFYFAISWKEKFGFIETMRRVSRDEPKESSLAKKNKLKCKGTIKFAFLFA